MEEDSTLYFIQEHYKTVMDSLQKVFMNEMEKFPKKKIQKKQKKSKVYSTLTLEIANHQLNGQYLEFDILVSSNNPNIYFENALTLKH